MLINARQRILKAATTISGTFAVVWMCVVVGLWNHAPGLATLDEPNLWGCIGPVDPMTVVMHQITRPPLSADRFNAWTRRKL